MHSPSVLVVGSFVLLVLVMFAGSAFGADPALATWAMVAGVAALFAMVARLEE